MAEAELVVPVQLAHVHLILSHDEAEALSYVLSAVGGCPSSSKRKYTDAIAKALYKAGYGYRGDFKKHYEEVSGNIHFLKEIE